MQQGIYGDITIKSGANVTMAPGIYYIGAEDADPPRAIRPPAKAMTDPKGSIKMQGGTLTGNGVMIYNQVGDKLDFKDATTVLRAQPTSGIYQGISIFQPRSDTREVHIESSGPVTISGTLYAQAGEFDLRPNGATTVFNCGNYITVLKQNGRKDINQTVSRTELST